MSPRCAFSGVEQQLMPKSCSWRAPSYVRERSEAENDKIREKFHILVSGDDVPPPIADFRVRSSNSRSVRLQLMQPSLAGHEASKTPPRPPQEQEDPLSDSHPAARTPRRVRPVILLLPPHALMPELQLHGSGHDWNRLHRIRKDARLLASTAHVRARGGEACALRTG